MREPDLYIVSANAAELEALRNDINAKVVIFAVIGIAYSLSAAVMLRIFWRNPAQLNVLLLVLVLMLAAGVMLFGRSLLKHRTLKRSAAFLLITGVITGKRLDAAGEGDAFVAINGREFAVGPDIFHEARIGARIGVREWYISREFYDYTFSPELLDNWLARSRRL